MKMMLAKFRQHYPQGSLVSELVKIDRGTYIVKASIQIEGIVIATALSGAQQVEIAEDNAKERALASLFLDREPGTDNRQLNANKMQNKAISTPSKVEIATPSPTQPVVSTNPLPQPLDPAIKEGSIKDDIDLKISETNLDLEQNVNFSEAESEPNIPSKITSSEVVDNSVLDSNQLQQEVSPPVMNNNLFGDTFEAEIPNEISFSEQNADEPASSKVTDSEAEAMHFNEIKQKTDIEIKRLGWTKEQGKEFLMSHYGKRSRLHLTDEQLLEFLRYLEKLPNPIA